MNQNVSGSLLAQYTAGDALANTVYTPPSNLRVEITRVVICNTTGGAGAASLFHDDDGTTYNNTTALMFAENVAANSRVELFTQGPNGGIHVSKNGTIGFTDSLAGGLTISIYGISQIITERM